MESELLPCPECDGPMHWQPSCLHCGNKGRSFEEWWGPQASACEQGPTLEEESFARAAWNAAWNTRAPSQAAAKLAAVRETLNTPSVMDIGFMLDKLREIVK